MQNKSIFSTICRRGKAALLSAILLTTLICSGCDDPLFSDDPDKTEVDVIATDTNSKTSDKQESKPSDEQKRVEMSAKEVFDKANPSVVNIYADKSLGSGVVYKIKDGYGYIITNAHVVGKADSFAVRLSDKRTFMPNETKLIGKDSRTDIAVITVEIGKNDNLQEVEFGDSDKVEQNEEVVAIGNARGHENSSSKGEIRSVNVIDTDADDKNINKYFITGAAINPGNSGGALLNMHGKVIGINCMRLRNEEGQNYAIPSNEAKKSADQLIEKGYVSWPYLGIKTETGKLDDETPAILITTVKKDSPADKAGLTEGDIILTVKDLPVSTIAELRKKLNDSGIGALVDIDYIRKTKQGFKKYEEHVKLEELPKGLSDDEWS